MTDGCHGLDHETYCARVDEEIHVLAAATCGADPDMPVATCGSWQLRNLVEHTGHIHRWASAIVAKLSARLLSRKAAGWPVPADPSGYAPWLVEGGRDLVDTLVKADPQAPCWVWGADPHVRFWSRRILHETTVHRCDAQLALGLPAVVAPDVAADGIDEFLANLPYAAGFAPGVRALRGRGERIRYACPQREASWSITLDPDGFTWSREPHGAVDAAVRADVADLYLLLWGRLGPDDPRLAVTGDRDLLRDWAQHSAI